MTYDLSACVELLFGGRPFVERVRHSAAAGVSSVEFWQWRNKDIDGLRGVLEDCGAQVTGFLVDPTGNLVNPTTHPDFLAGVAESCAVAGRLGSPNLIVLAGDALPDTGRERQRDAVVDALQSAAPIAADHGVTLLLEPLNTVVDHPGHFLSDTAEGFDIVRRVDHANLLLLYDLYHSVVMGERPEGVLAGDMPLVGHVQVADAPGRQQPGTGGIDWARQIGTLAALGYRGRIGLEYEPVGDSAASLTHLRDVIASVGPAR